MRKTIIFLFALCCFATGTANAQEETTEENLIAAGWVRVENAETGVVAYLSPEEWAIINHAITEEASYTPSGPLGRTEVLDPETGEVVGYSEAVVVQPNHPVADIRTIQEVLRAESQGKLLAMRMDADDPRSRDFASLIGLSEPQLVHFQAKFKEIEEQLEQDDINRRVENLNLSPEELVILENDISQFVSQATDKFDALVHEVLTPEQLLKAREIDLVLPSPIFGDIFGDSEENDFPFNFAAYAALGLSEEQSEAFDEMQEQWNQELQQIFDDAKSKLSQGMDIEEEAAEKLKKIAKKYKTKIESALTPQQKEKLADLRKEIPKELAALAAQKETEVAEEDDSWKNSWKPGDPLPESMQHLAQPKEPRFPSKK